MKQNTMLILALVVLGTACVPMPRKRPPELRGKLPVPEVSGSPTIRLEIDAEGKDRKRLDDAVKKARRKLDFLELAHRRVESPDYTIRLDASPDIRAIGDTDACHLAAYSLFVIPCWTNSEVWAGARVLDAAGTQIAHFSGNGRMRVIYQMHLVYALPITAIMHPMMTDRMWNQAVRRALSRAGTAIEEHQRARAARAARLERPPDTGRARGPVLARHGSAW
jgi:hypothetical protein